MKDHKPLGVRVVVLEVDINTFQRQLGSIAISRIPGSALAVPEGKAMLSMPMAMTMVSSWFRVYKIISVLSLVILPPHLSSQVF